ncbi:MAG: hypothetical protein JWR21_4346 [Herminiimonas sp.]|nr:hypothetical protein [Herminiimonas sp.]
MTLKSCLNPVATCNLGARWQYSLNVKRSVAVSKSMGPMQPTVQENRPTTRLKFVTGGRAARQVESLQSQSPGSEVGALPYRLHIASMSF